MEFALEELAEIKEALRMRSFEGTCMYQKVSKELDIRKGEMIKLTNDRILQAQKDCVGNISAIINQQQNYDVLSAISYQIDHYQQITQELTKRIDWINNL